MSKAANANKSGRPPKHRKRNPQAMRNLMVSVLGATGTLYLATNSVAVTVVGAIAALSAAFLYLMLDRK